LGRINGSASSFVKHALDDGGHHERRAGQDGAVLLDAVRRKQADTKSNVWGYEVITNQIVDLFKAGVIDPAKVVRSAVENAVSIAGMILTTEALITDLPEKDKAPAMPGGGGMDY